MNTADIIKKRREELGLSQKELAEKLDYKSRSSINKIELGLSDIPFAKIPSFAKALDIKPEALMGWEDQIPIQELENLNIELESLNKFLTGECRIESAYLSLTNKNSKEILNQILKNFKDLIKETSKINSSKKTHDFYINDNLAGDIKYKNKKISILMGNPNDESSFKELDLNSDKNIKLGTVISLIQLALEKVELDSKGFVALEKLLSNIIIKNYKMEDIKLENVKNKKVSISNKNKDVSYIAAAHGVKKK